MLSCLREQQLPVQPVNHKLQATVPSLLFVRLSIPSNHHTGVINTDAHLAVELDIMTKTFAVSYHYFPGKRDGKNMLDQQQDWS